MNWSNADLARHRAKGAAKVVKVRKVTPPQKALSEIEALFDVQMRVHKIPTPVMNYQFVLTRGWMLDRAWPEHKFAVEIDGHVHRIKQRFEADCEKFAFALLAGWTVLHITGKYVRDGRGINWLREIFLQRRIIPASRVPIHHTTSEG